MGSAISYIDGFNLYYGLREANLRRYLWLDVHELSKNLLSEQDELICTKYFTARISGPPDKRKRQTTYLEALSTVPEIQIYYGSFLMNETQCNSCGRKSFVPKEKQTDVNIATEMLVDAFENKFDTAYLVTADSDLIGPIMAIKRLFPEKRIVIGFPPRRISSELKKATGTFSINETQLRKSQFPARVKKQNGYYLRRPWEWNR